MRTRRSLRTIRHAGSPSGTNPGRSPHPQLQPAGGKRARRNDSKSCAPPPRATLHHPARQSETSPATAHPSQRSPAPSSRPLNNVPRVSVKGIASRRRYQTLRPPLHRPAALCRYRYAGSAGREEYSCIETGSNAAPEQGPGQSPRSKPPPATPPVPTPQTPRAVPTAAMTSEAWHPRARAKRTCSITRRAPRSSWARSTA
jgi:hypothetical protein